MAQLIAVLTVPIAAIIIFFSREVLFVWTGDPLTAHRSATILCVLMCGTMVNALLYPCYTLQIAHGWTRLIFATTALGAIVLVPTLIVFAMKFGAVGAAFVWLMLNAVFVIVPS